jgi:hypothetical protein
MPRCAAQPAEVDVLDSILVTHKSYTTTVALRTGKRSTILVRRPHYYHSFVLHGNAPWTRNPEVEIFTTENTSDEEFDVIYYPGALATGIHAATEVGLLALNVLNIRLIVRSAISASRTESEIMYNLDAEIFEEISTHHRAIGISDAARVASNGRDGVRHVDRFIRDFREVWAGLSTPGYYELVDHIPQGEPLITHSIHKRDLVEHASAR